MSLRIRGEIPKYIGELQRTAEFRRDTLARRRFLTEDAHRQSADGDRHALTIAIQLRKAGRPDVGLRFHFRAIDDGEEIVTPQTIKAYGFVQTKGHSVPRPTAIEMGYFIAPVQQEGFLQQARCLAIRDVVDFTAKGVKARTRPRDAEPAGNALPRRTSCQRLPGATQSRRTYSRVRRWPDPGLRAPKLKTFYCVHGVSLRDDEINRYCRDGRIISRNGASSVVCSDIGQRFDRRFTAPQRWVDWLLASTPKFARILLRMDSE
jgi:hypothetical protein